MSNLELWYPVKDPVNQNNLFGTTSPLYTSMGLQKGHPGLDFSSKLDTPLFAPCSGDAFYTKDAAGGDGIWIRWPNNQAPEYNIILWHLPPSSDPIYHPMIRIADNDPITTVKIGDKLGYTGNSGYPLESTGPHLHLGVMPCKLDGSALYPNNGYEGCVDPMPFFNGLYAENYQPAEQIITAVGQINLNPNATVQQKLQVDNALVAFLKWLFPSLFK